MKNVTNAFSKSVGEVWDSRYEIDEYRYGKKPNAFMASQAERFPAGASVLCLGDGEGRNGVWLAEQGFTVTSVDASSRGVEKTRALAKERGVTVDAFQGTVPSEWKPADAAYDGVVLTFVHMPPEIRKAVHDVVTRALKPGGTVILEAYTPAQLGKGTGGPPVEALMFTADMLKEDFAALELEDIEEMNVVLKEGISHDGESEVVRLVAIKR